MTTSLPETPEQTPAQTGSIPALIGVAPLLRMAFAGEDLMPLGQELLARASANPLDAHALLDFSTVLQLTGNRDHALAVQAEAIALQAHYTLPARGDGAGLRLLVIMGPGDLMANTPLEFLVEDSDVTLELYYLTADGHFPEQIPDHDVMLVAVAESEDNLPLLCQLAEYVSNWPRPVINRPEHIAMLSRDGVCAALGGIAGVDMPVTVRADRATLAALADGRATIGELLPDGGFPIIVRPIGSHAGTNLDKIATSADLQAYLDTVADERFYVARFVDYRSADGLFRKYRIALIEGRPFVCHFALSDHWMIHYRNAGMDESIVKRDEEAARMTTFDQDFALRHADALKAIEQRLQLPYIGLDCAETLAGDILIFEADNAMIVHAMDPEEMFPYKRPAMDKVFTAFRQLLEHARQNG